MKMSEKVDKALGVVVDKMGDGAIVILEAIEHPQVAGRKIGHIGLGSIAWVTAAIGVAAGTASFVFDRVSARIAEKADDLDDTLEEAGE